MKSPFGAKTLQTDKHTAPDAYSRQKSHFFPVSVHSLQYIHCLLPLFPHVELFNIGVNLIILNMLQYYIIYSLRYKEKVTMTARILK